MSDVIQLLPDSIANQIAAGEVVQRPASVVKELLENSIDAGASEIRLLIKDSGKTLVQVIDNGTGMSDTDARMSFERHATSKIRKAEDLFQLHTMGFRGEALASIASVAWVEMKTRREEDNLGSWIVVEGGKLDKHEPVACNKGTSISVKNLFFNIPVRKNFLSSNNIEYKHVVEEFVHIALSHPQIKLIMSSLQNEIYYLLKGSLRQRVISVFGKRYDKFLIPIEENTPLVNITGFIGKPEAAKKSRGDQHLFVNNRFIRNNYFNHAVMGAYDSLLPENTFPFYVLFLEIPSHKIDVNVHPTKTEIKFEDEKALYSIIKASIRKALGQHHLSLNLDFEHEAFLNAMERENKKSLEEQSKLRIDVGAQTEKNDSFRVPTVKASEKDWQELLKVLNLEKSQKETSDTVQSGLPEIESGQEPDSGNVPIAEKVLQIHNKYLVTPIKTGVMFINQQFAHQRILYEDFLQKYKAKKVSTQKIMFPEVLEFSESGFSVIREMMPVLQQFGFDMEPFGQRAIVINGLPVELKNPNTRFIIDSLISDYESMLGNIEDEFPSKIALALAVQTSVKDGDRLSQEEIMVMIDRLFACENPYYSPTGKPVFIKIDQTELDKKFD